MSKLSSSATRRQTFATIFHQYPAVLYGVSKGCGIGTLGMVQTDDIDAMADALLAKSDFRERVRRVLAGQLLTRLIATRAEIERENSGASGIGLGQFHTKTVEAYNQLRADNLGVFHIQTGSQPAQILAAMESNIASVAFSSLQVEATISAEAFDEAGFWADLFRGIGDTDPTTQISRVFSRLFLDRLDEWRQVLQDDAIGWHALNLPAN